MVSILSPGLTWSTNDPNEIKLTVYGVSPSGIDSGVSCNFMYYLSINVHKLWIIWCENLVRHF